MRVNGFARLLCKHAHVGELPVSLQANNYSPETVHNYERDLNVFDNFLEQSHIVPTAAHSLRHGFATYLAEEGANPAALQILLGHESLDTTTRYVHASDKYAEETHRKYHPLS